MRFEWDDGAQDAYASTLWLPNVEVQQEQRAAVVPTLDLGAVRIVQTRSGSSDTRAPRLWVLEWPVLDHAVIATIEESWREDRAVTVSFWRRGEQVTVSGCRVIDFEDPAYGEGGLYGCRVTLLEAR